MADKKKILLVDDEKESLFYLGNFLRRKDYDVVTASDGKQAITAAKKEKPDLIILDIVMPELDGGRVAEILAANPSTAEIPIIFLTAIMKPNEQKRVEKTGEHYILAKPVEEESFMQTINKIFSENPSS